MHTPTWIPGGWLLWISGIVIAFGSAPGRQQDRPGRPADQQKRAARTPKQGSDQQKPRRPQQSRKREERRARSHIASAYPRTRNLLHYLEKHDAAAYQALLSHSAKLTRRRQNAAIKLAREHHPELARLIVRLRRRFPRAYNSAIRELLADHARLERAKQAGDVEYQATLAEWKIRSQVRLVAARMSLANQPEFQKRLEDLLAKGEQAKRRQIRLQIERYKKQIARLQRRLDQDPAQNVQRQLRTIHRRAKKQAKTDKRRPK